MILVEPPSAYTARMLRANLTTFAPAPSEPARPAEASKESYWEQILFETLRLEGGLPVKIVSLVSASAKWGDYGCRADRENRKLELLRLVGQLIQAGKLRRFARNYVLLPTEAETQQSNRERASGLPAPKNWPPPST